jgi:hypothetical protein
VIESAFNPKAYSRAKASGIWQFIPSTGKNYGLAQDWWKDNRRDIVAATDAALELPRAPAQDVRRLGARARRVQRGRRHRLARHRLQPEEGSADGSSSTISPRLKPRRAITCPS